MRSRAWGSPFAKFALVGRMPVMTRLLLMILCCLAPMIAMQVAIGWMQWNERKGDVSDVARHQAGLLAADMGSIAEGVRLLLATTAEFREVRAGGEACDERLDGIQRNAPSLSFVALVGANGQILCASSTNIAAIANGSNWSRDAVSAAVFTTGHFGRLPSIPQGFLPFYFPFEREDTLARGVLTAALNLAWLRDHFTMLKQGQSEFLAAAVLTVTDSDGVVLGRNPNHDEFVGHVLPAAAKPMLTASKPGILKLKSIDGAERLVAFVPPSAATRNLAIAAGFDEADLMADTKRELLWNFLLLGMIAALAFVLTWAMARRLITRPTEALMAVASDWREGRLSSRAPVYDQGSEFGQIAAAWNEMAEALQKRQKELQEYSEALEARVAERTESLLSTNNRLQVEIAERQNTEAALVQSQKLQAVGHLAGGVAHDFNNLLGTIQGSLDLLAVTLPRDDAKQRIWVQRASQAVQRGVHLTARLLAFSRRRHLSVRATEVNRLIGDLAAMFTTTMLGGQIRVVTQLASEPCFAMAEPSQLEAAVLNLALNARDAMPRGGVLTISTAYAKLDGEPDHQTTGEYVMVTVSDTGIGMDPEVKAKALEPFFTTKGATGSGLGLSQVEAMVEEAGGSLHICSRVGEGTSVRLLLPRAAESESAPKVTPAKLMTNPSRGKALVVDDDTSVLQVTADMLRQFGYCVLEARSAHEALEMIDRYLDDLDIAIIDYVMPEMNGLALIGELRRLGVKARIVLATGYADLEPRDMNSHGFQVLLSKPYTFADFQHAIARTADEGASSEPIPSELRNPGQRAEETSLVSDRGS